ncbi:MAG: recombinase family protein [Dehalococcoidia bacterium]
MEGPARAALYARVSTEEQTKGYSIGAQRRAFQALCEGRGWTNHHEYVEAGKSARTDDIRKRPVFKQAVDDGLAGKYDLLVVHKIDRFSRKLRVTLEYFEKLGKAGVGFVSIENQIDYSTPSGKLMLVMQGGLAELYSDNLSQETKKGWDERKKQGLYCGLLPFGAMKGENGVPVPHPDTYQGLTLAFEVAAQGKTDREVAAALNAAGHRTAGNQSNGPFSKDTVGDMLQNRFYLGEIPDGNGGWLEAKHEPFIDPSLFEAAQAHRARRCHSRNGKVRRQAMTFSMSGLVKCGICGSTVSVHRNKDDKPRVFCRGRAKGLECDCKGTFLDVYETQLHWYLENFHIPEDYRDKILEAHRKLESAYDDISKKQAQLENRLRRLQEQYEWGHIAKDEYLDKHNEIRRELSVITPTESSDKTLDRLAHFLGNVASAWQEATQEQRNKLAATLFENVIIEHNRVVSVKPRDELRPFFQLSYEEHQKSHTLTGAPSGPRYLLSASTWLWEQACYRARSRIQAAVGVRVTRHQLRRIGLPCGSPVGSSSISSCSWSSILARNPFSVLCSCSRSFSGTSDVASITTFFSTSMAGPHISSPLGVILISVNGRPLRFGILFTRPSFSILLRSPAID